jgi:hypothetical protein
MKFKILLTLFSLVVIFTAGFENSLAQRPLKNGDDGTKLVTPEPYTPAQDSAFKKAMELRIPPEIRFEYELEKMKLDYQFHHQNDKSDVWMASLIDMHKRYPDLFKPDQVEIMQATLAKKNSFYVPYLNVLGNGGVQIPLTSIGKFLGVLKDTSPVIKYNLEYDCHVEVVIYNMSGVVIAILADERQKPGKYTYVWNFRDDDGTLYEEGEFIAEVRKGKFELFRKTIIK